MKVSGEEVIGGEVISKPVIGDDRETGIDFGALIERGELLIEQRNLVRPTGPALEDLKAIETRTVFLYEPLPKQHLDLFIRLAGEAVRAAFAVGFRVGIKGTLQVGQPLHS